jgi:predicted kinase
VQRLVLVSGPTGTGKSVLANAIASDLMCAVDSFDWLMSALRGISEVWKVVELPVERQRAVGWSLLTRLAEQELRHGRSLVLDLVAREQPRQEWISLANRYRARFSVIECTCGNAALQRERVEQRCRDIPGWYELTWSQVEASRTNYVALGQPKLVVDAVHPLEQNVAVVREYLGMPTVQSR